MKPTHALRKLLDREGAIVAPGAHNAFVAKIIEKAGFKALYMSGSGTSVALMGRPDIGLTTMTEVVMNARFIVNTVDIPVIADANTGYGNAINVMRTVSEFIKAGVAAIHIEDQQHPKRCGHLAGKQLISVEEMIGKIKAADEVRRRLGSELVIIARTDARFAVDGGFEETIKRGNAYAEAGADLVFPETPLSKEEMQLFVKKINVPLHINLVEGGKIPLLSVKELEEMGYKLITFSNSALRVIHKAVTELMKGLKKTGTTKGFLDKMTLFPGHFELMEIEKFHVYERNFLPTLDKGGEDGEKSDRL